MVYGRRWTFLQVALDNLTDMILADNDSFPLKPTVINLLLILGALDVDHFCRTYKPSNFEASLSCEPSASQVLPLLKAHWNPKCTPGICWRNHQRKRKERGEKSATVK